MRLRRIVSWSAVLGICVSTACSHPKPVVASKPAVVPPPAPVVSQPVMVPPTAANPPVLVTSAPVAAPPQTLNGPLPGSVLAWDSEMKSIDAHEGDAEGALAFSFTNVSANAVIITSVNPGCHCTAAHLPPVPWTIPPGSNGTIDVTIDLRGKVGTLFKNLTVSTDHGIKTLNFRVNIMPVVLPTLTSADRANNVKIALGDRQAVFKGDCVTCHVNQGQGKYGKDLYVADCAICHESPNRATMVPDLHNLKVATSTEFWRIWIAHGNGKPGAMMPAFSTTDGGPLSDMQIASLAVYLNFIIPPRPAAQ